MARFEEARDMACYVKLVAACYPTTEGTDMIVFIAGFYVAYIAMRLVLRVARPYVKTLGDATHPTLNEYMCSLKLTLSYPNSDNPSDIALKVRAAALAILNTRDLLGDYIRMAGSATAHMLTTKIPAYSNILTIGAKRHLHDIRKGDVTDKPQKCTLKRDRRGNHVFDLKTAEHVAVTDEYFWLVEEAWMIAESLALCAIVVCMSLTRSKDLMGKIAREFVRVGSAISVEDLRQFLLPEATNTAWKPAFSTYDTSTCNVEQTKGSERYKRSLWNVVDHFMALFTHPQGLRKLSVVEHGSR